MKYLYISIVLSLLGVIILVSNKKAQIEYHTVEVIKTDGMIIAERVDVIMASDEFIQEMKHIAIARAMLELSAEYLEQAETLQHAGNENMQRSLSISNQYYGSNF